MPAPTNACVFVVDDDPHVRKALRWLIESVHLNVTAFESGEQFLQAYRADEPGCVVLDVRMPGKSGVQILEDLRAQGAPIPVIILTGHANVRVAVRAMRAGAVAVVEKPYTDQELLDLIQNAVAKDAELRREAHERAAVAHRIGTLSAREGEVLRRVVLGEANKVMAAELAISEKTVEAHRKRIMEKMHARSLAELIRMALLHTPDWGKP